MIYPEPEEGAAAAAAEEEAAVQPLGGCLVLSEQ